MENRTNRYVALVLASLVLCLPTGCQQAPQEVADRMEKYHDNPQAEEFDIAYCMPRQLCDASIDDLAVVPENLKLPVAVDFSGIQDIGLLELEFVKDYTKQKEKIAGVFGVEAVKLERSDEESEIYEHLLYDDENEKKYLSVADNGLFSYLESSCYELDTLGTEEEAEKMYDATKRLYLGTGDDIDIEWTLAGETVSVAKQVEWAEKWLIDSGIFPEDFTYPVRTVYLRKFPDGRTRMGMLAQMRYHGVPLAYAGGGIQWDGTIPYLARMDDDISLTMDNPYQILQCSTNGLFDVVKYEEQEKVVDFPSAVRIAADALSGFQTVEIRKIEAIYTLSPQYDYKEENASYNKPGNKVKARPVYCFMIPYCKDLSEVGAYEDGEVCVVNVDMLTGEVTSDLEEKNYVNK